MKTSTLSENDTFSSILYSLYVYCFDIKCEFRLIENKKFKSLLIEKKKIPKKKLHRLIGWSFSCQ